MLVYVFIKNQKKFFYWNDKEILINDSYRVNKSGWYLIEGEIEKLDSLKTCSTDNFNFFLKLESTINSSDLKKDLQWFEFLKNIQKIMSNLNLLEVYTPNLVKSPGVETYIEAFELNNLKLNEEQKVYLPTSPEFSLKKLLFNGFTQIFEIKTSFRNEESSPNHLAEFYMLEWYRVGASLSDILKDVKSLVDSVERLFQLEAKMTTWNQKSVSEVFKEFLNFDLTAKTTWQELKICCIKNHLNFAHDDSWNDLFFRLFLTYVEPKMLEKYPNLILYNYPPSQSALAKIDSQTGWANRLEVYYRGRELANGYDELMDGTEILKRFNDVNKQRLGLGKKVVAVDWDLIKTSQKTKIPATAGIALGLERLYMGVLNLKDINQVRTQYI